MDLQELIKQNAEEQKWHQDYVDSYERKLNALTLMTQPTVEEFYQNITTDKYYSVIFENKKYEYILGGDGRSSAWSEWRDGVVLTVKVKKYYYLTDEFITALTKYVKEKYQGQYNHLDVISISIK
jgi:hypothetical protein